MISTLVQGSAATKRLKNTDVDFPVNLHVHSVPSISVPEKTQSADLLPSDTVCNTDVPDDCQSSDSDTVVFSRHSSMDDLTVVYRSPMSDVTFDLDALLLNLDQQEDVDGSLETDKNSMKSGRYNDEELRPCSYLDCDRVISQSYPTDVSGSVQFLSKLVEIPASSESLGGMLNAEKLQSAPLPLIGLVNEGLRKQHAVSDNLSEFKDNKGLKNTEVAGPSLLMSS